MFKKLKLRLLGLNMIAIMLLMLFAFGSIYITTYNKTHHDIIFALNRGDNFNPNALKPFEEDNRPEPLDKDSVKLPEREIVFAINLTYDREIISYHSFFEEEDSFFEEAVSLAQSSDNKIIELDDSKWAFKINPRDNHYQLFFVEVTNQLGMLDKLLYNFIIVFFIMLVLTFIMSNYLTSVSIKPIKSAFEKQNQFISDASHELKTPLAIINSNVDVLLGSADDESKKWLEYIQSEVIRMSKLTENLLYLSQFDVQDNKQELSEVNLSDTTEHVLLGLEAVAYEKNMTLDYDIDPDIEVKGHQEQLSQVIMILIDNAMKYGESKIFVSLKNEHNAVYLKVKNNGETIDEEAIKHIFDRFYKVDDSRSKSGYGLGLSIAKSIVEQHNGKISCKSNDDETSFKVKLPI